MPNAKYQPGQVWTYHTREGEGASRLTILKVESEPKTGTIVHVAADGVSIANAKAPAGSSSKIEHMPFAEAAIDASVIEHVDTTRVPDFQEGYDAWRTAFEGGRGGVFRLPVAEAVEHMEQAMRQAGR